MNNPFNLTNTQLEELLTYMLGAVIEPSADYAKWVLTKAERMAKENVEVCLKAMLPPPRTQQPSETPMIDGALHYLFVMNERNRLSPSFSDSEGHSSIGIQRLIMDAKTIERECIAITAERNRLLKLLEKTQKRTAREVQP